MAEEHHLHQMDISIGGFVLRLAVLTTVRTSVQSYEKDGNWSARTSIQTLKHR